METEYQYLLHLLGAYLREEAPDSVQVNWDTLLNIAQIHNVPGILGYMSRKYPICPDSRYTVHMRGLCMATISLFGQRHAMALDLVRQLEQAGIDHILMKGFVLRDYYPVPELRSFTDIDLVIRPDDRKKTHQLMISQGFRVKDDWEPVYSYYRGNEYYEIHTEIMEIDVSTKADYRGFFRTMWEHTQMVSPHSYRFSPEFHFLYMLTHIAKHIHGSGAGIRLYLDVAAFIRRHGDGLDWTWIERQLRELKLYDFACVALTAVERWFGIPSPMRLVPVSDAIIREFTKFTLEAGLFGHYAREGALAKMKHQERDTAADRTRLLLKRAFPGAETIQGRYTYLQDRPWLVPVAWVHRLVKTREGMGKHMEEARQIIHADTQEVDRLKKLTRDIGL